MCRQFVIPSGGGHRSASLTCFHGLVRAARLLCRRADGRRRSDDVETAPASLAVHREPGRGGEGEGDLRRDVRAINYGPLVFGELDRDRLDSWPWGGRFAGPTVPRVRHVPGAVTSEAELGQCHQRGGLRSVGAEHLGGLPGTRIQQSETNWRERAGRDGVLALRSPMPNGKEAIWSRVRQVRI